MIAWQFLLAFTLLSAIFGANAEEGIERPTWSVNDTWTFGLTVGPTTINPAEMRYEKTYTVTEVRDTYYRGSVATTPVQGTGGELPSTVNGNMSRDLNDYYRENVSLPYTELRSLQWPLSVGKSWSYEHPMADGRVFEWRAKVERWETVTVPAGHFKTLVIQIDGQARGGDMYAQKRTIWFSPDTKSKVKELWYGIWKSYTIDKQIYELERYSAR
jgi:Protein of unknown function (DUF3108)